MSNLNRIILIGRLADNPESRTTMEGISVTKFRLIVGRPAGAGTDYFDITAWRNMAEFASQYLKKGNLVLLEGRIQIRSLQNQMGDRQWLTEIVASKLQPLDSNLAAAKPSAPSNVSREPGKMIEEVEELPVDDLPF